MYHKIVFNLFICTILVIAGCSCLANNCGNAVIEPGLWQTQGRINTIVSQIQQKHAVRVYYQKGPYFSWLLFNYKLAPKSDYPKLLKYFALLQNELDKYPTGFLNSIKIKSIVICKDISSSGHSAIGFSDPRSKTVYYSYFDPTESREVIHHEIYHMIEAKFNGSLFYKDTTWAKLNSEDFRYGNGGKYYKSHISDWDKPYYHPYPGFITSYAKSALEEDKAEVYASLCLEELSTDLQQWMKDDPILRTKVNYIKAFLFQNCSTESDN